MVIAAMKLKYAYSFERCNDQPRQHIQKQRHYFANKGLSSQGYGFPVVMYGCESWMVVNAELLANLFTLLFHFYQEAL